MGYPMHWLRLCNRNSLQGNYEFVVGDPERKQLSLIAGDMRRLEHDMQDDVFVPMFAAYAGITDEQVRKVLAAFFDVRVMEGKVPENLYTDLYSKAYPDAETMP